MHFQLCICLIYALLLQMIYLHVLKMAMYADLILHLNLNHYADRNVCSTV